jgi:hypothetical protein
MADILDACDGLTAVVALRGSAGPSDQMLLRVACASSTRITITTRTQT